jgi:colanic acid/amylovoran biosynthesis glycosyltransferase
MKRNVLHFVRKSTQLNATFINGQITNHINYNPSIVIKENVIKKYDGGYVEADYCNYKILNLNSFSNNKIKYKLLRRISKPDVKRILDFIEDNKIDVLHFHYGTDAGLYYEVMKSSGKPSVVYFYGYDSSSFPRMFFGFGKIFLQKRVFKYATKILAMSEDMKNDIKKIGCDEKKIIVYYNGVNGGIYNYSGKKYLQNEKTILLIVGSLVPQKGHLFLLECINRLKNNNLMKNVELEIVGIGELENELKKYVNDNNLDKYVRFIRPIKAYSPEILEVYRNADIFIHPSVIPKNGDKEGIPGTIVEAMFSGLPVISTYHAGISSIIKNDENGLLVKEWDIDKLTEYITRLVKDVSERERLGKAGQKYALENLNLLKNERKLEEIYDSIICK